MVNIDRRRGWRVVTLNLRNMYDPFVEPDVDGYCEDCGANLALGENHHFDCPYYEEMPDAEDEDNYDDDNLTERDNLYNQ